MNGESVSAGIDAPDDALVCLFRSGGSDAFEALYKKHYVRILNFALHLTGNRTDAEDIAQDVFLKALKGMNGLQDGQAFLGWLYRITVNVVRDRSRRAQRKPWTSLFELMKGSSTEQSEPIEFADPDMDPGRLTELKEQHKALLKALQELPEDYREVFVLHHMHDMDVSEIARLIQSPEGTVKSRLSRARSRLRQSMSEWLDKENDNG
jgi:RNA polymerase sigma-70 factor (ECF subfamily)